MSRNEDVTSGPYYHLYKRYRFDDLAAVDPIGEGDYTGEWIAAWLSTLILAQMKCHLLPRSPELLLKIVRKARKIVFGKLTLEGYLRDTESTLQGFRSRTETGLRLAAQLAVDPQLAALESILSDVARVVADVQVVHQTGLFLSAVNAFLGLEALRSSSPLHEAGKLQWMECAATFDLFMALSGRAEFLNIIQTERYTSTLSFGLSSRSISPLPPISIVQEYISTSDQ